MRTRSAAVEGRFYPSTKSRIFDQIMEIEYSGRYPEPDLSPKKVIGAVLPHAGHLYSGYQTIPFFQLLRRHSIFPDTFVIVHPNHSGLGTPLAIDDSESWSNSIGEVPVDTELARAMELPFDKMAHAREHSAEVIIPFMQYFLSDHPFSIVPVCMMDQTHKSASLVAERIIRAVKKTRRKVMVIASCDFSHFLPPSKGAEQDQLVIKISDTGLGIPEDEQSKIFEKFYRVKSHRDQVPGTGLGLSVVKQIIHGHGGEINFTSEVDVGTTFTITLPYEVQ